ncbi:unnamed protein product [Tuber aestivum]|uniref:RRM domain-containing protein n=1 Tax=Tuber aestivum TaxID=59557 RepID=A0A292PMT0_9PEZI|nr:unnamed protein product [Tuber aestivum]
MDLRLWLCPHWEACLALAFCASHRSSVVNTTPRHHHWSRPADIILGNQQSSQNFHIGFQNSFNRYPFQWIVPEPVPSLGAAPPAVQTLRLVEVDLILEIPAPPLVLIPEQDLLYPIDLGLRHNLPFPGQGREAGVAVGEEAIHEAPVLRYRVQRFAAPILAYSLPLIVIEKLTKNVTEAHIAEIFSSYGEIKMLDMPLNHQYNTNRGVCYVIYHSSSSAHAAIAHMHEGQLDGAVVNLYHVAQTPPAPALALRLADLPRALVTVAKLETVTDPRLVVRMWVLVLVPEGDFLGVIVTAEQPLGIVTDLLRGPELDPLLSHRAQDPLPDLGLDPHIVAGNLPVGTLDTALPLGPVGAVMELGRDA